MMRSATEYKIFHLVGASRSNLLSGDGVHGRCTRRPEIGGRVHSGVMRKKGTPDENPELGKMESLRKVPEILANKLKPNI